MPPLYKSRVSNSTISSIVKQILKVSSNETLTIGFPIVADHHVQEHSNILTTPKSELDLFSIHQRRWPETPSQAISKPLKTHNKYDEYKARIISETWTHMDITTSICLLLNIPQPYTSIGNPIFQVFDFGYILPINYTVPVYNANKNYTVPKFNRVSNLFVKYGINSLKATSNAIRAYLDMPISTRGRYKQDIFAHTNKIINFLGYMSEMSDIESEFMRGNQEHRSKYEEKIFHFIGESLSLLLLVDEIKERTGIGIDYKYELIVMGIILVGAGFLIILIFIIALYLWVTAQEREELLKISVIHMPKLMLTYLIIGIILYLLTSSNLLTLGLLTILFFLIVFARFTYACITSYFKDAGEGDKDKDKENNRQENIHNKEANKNSLSLCYTGLFHILLCFLLAILLYFYTNYKGIILYYYYIYIYI